MTSDVTLSSLSGEELLSILRQSLAKKKEVDNDPIVKSSSSTTLVEDEILQPIPYKEANEDNVHSEKIEGLEEEDGMVLEGSDEIVVDRADHSDQIAQVSVQVVDQVAHQVADQNENDSKDHQNENDYKDHFKDHYKDHYKDHNEAQVAFTTPKKERRESSALVELDQNKSMDRVDDLGFSPDEFLRDVLSHPPSVAEPETNFLDAKYAFQLGKLASYLAYSASFESFYSNLSVRLENLKKEASVKKVAWQDAKENYRILREDIDKAIKKMEVSALDFKDAEQDKVVLESVLDWITRVKEKSAIKSEDSLKDLGVFARNIPSSWTNMVGSQVVSFIESHASPVRSSKTVTNSSTPESVSKSRDVTNEKMAVLSRLGSKDCKRRVEEICADFNKNSCPSKHDTCKNFHICLNCGGPHPVTSCGPSKATERVLCVQWNVDERKCRDNKCGREHRCIRCMSTSHTIIKCNSSGASKAVIRTYCYLWNASSVNYCHTRDCRRIHGCLRCGERTHGALSCPDNVETYYKDSPSGTPQKRSRSSDRDKRRDVRGRVNT